MSCDFFVSLVYFDMDDLAGFRFGLCDIFDTRLHFQNRVGSWHVRLTFLFLRLLRQPLGLRGTLLSRWLLFQRHLRGSRHGIEGLHLGWSWSQSERLLLLRLHILILKRGQLLDLWLSLLVEVVHLLSLLLSHLLIGLFSLQGLLHLLLLKS